MRIRRSPRRVRMDMRLLVRFLPLVPLVLVVFALVGCGSKY